MASSVVPSPASRIREITSPPLPNVVEGQGRLAESTAGDQPAGWHEARRSSSIDRAAFGTDQEAGQLVHLAHRRDGDLAGLRGGGFWRD